MYHHGWHPPINLRIAKTDLGNKIVYLVPSAGHYQRELTGWNNVQLCFGEREDKLNRAAGKGFEEVE